MSTQRDFPILWRHGHGAPPYLPSMVVLAAVAALALGAGVILSLPDESNNETPGASATADAPESAAAADESLCEQQAWPYIDQRCAGHIEAARGTRQVRIVTDRGNSVTVVTQQPIVEPKQKRAPPPPVVAVNDRQIGPPAAPTVAGPAPQTEKVATAPQEPAAAPAPQPSPQPGPAPAVQAAVAPAGPPAATDALAREAPSATANTRNASIAPAAASSAPVASGVETFAEDIRPKSRSERRAERAAEKAAKREARREARSRKIVAVSDGVPEEVIAAVRRLPAGGQSGRRARSAVPDEVIAAVEQAVTTERGGDRIRLVPPGEIRGW